MSYFDNRCYLPLWIDVLSLITKSGLIHRLGLIHICSHVVYRIARGLLTGYLLFAAFRILKYDGYISKNSELYKFKL